jgi:formylglycine-generating enzyme required for sulfatase activity
MLQHYKVPGLDDRITPDQIRTYREGYARISELPPNEIGLYGLLGHAREWCDAPKPQGGGQSIHWEEYFTNYDNAIGYQVRCRPAEVGQGLAFRLACSAVAV